VRRLADELVQLPLLAFEFGGDRRQVTADEQVDEPVFMSPVRRERLEDGRCEFDRVGVAAAELSASRGHGVAECCAAGSRDRW
jgi:hypothetical protein